MIDEYSTDNLIYDPKYLGVERSDRVVQVTMIARRKPQQKRALYERMTELLAKSPGPRQQDLVIYLVETAWEKWSFGNGAAQYMDS